MAENYKLARRNRYEAEGSLVTDLQTDNAKESLSAKLIFQLIENEHRNDISMPS